MKNCNKVNRLLPALLAGELAQATAGELERHLAGCAACRQARAGLEADRALLGELPSAAPGIGLVTRVMAEVRATGRPATSPRWVRALATAAAVLLVVGGAWAGTMVGTSLAGPERDSEQGLVATGETFAEFAQDLFQEE